MLSPIVSAQCALRRSNVMQSTIFHFATDGSEQSHALMFWPIPHFGGRTLCLFSQHEREPQQRERERGAGHSGAP